MSLSMDLSTNAARVMIKYDEIDGERNGNINKLSKSQKIVKKLKNLKGLKSHKCHWFGGTKLLDL